MSPRRATRTSTRSARTTSTPTPRRSCRWSRAISSPTSPPCGSSSRMAGARCPTTGPLMRLLHDVIDVDNILFASEMLGAVRGVDPQTGFHWDDTKRYVDALDLADEDRRKVVELDARRVYPRLDARLAAIGKPVM